MAELLLGNIKPAGADNIVVDSRYVKGGYIVASYKKELFPTTEAEIKASLKGTNGENIVEGSLCYCQEDDKFYQYNGTAWVEKKFGTPIAAGEGITVNADSVAHSIPNGATAEERGSTVNRTYVKTITTDKFGHVTGVTTGAETITDTNQKIKAGSVTFDANDEVNIVAGTNVTVSGDKTNKQITISATDTNTAHNHSAGVGLVLADTGTGGTSGTVTYKTKLKSETALTRDAVAATETANRVYPVSVDKSGYLAVNIPWTDTNTQDGNDNQTVKTGNVTFGVNDVVEFVAGSNVSIVGDATNKKITISSTDTNTETTLTVIDKPSTDTTDLVYAVTNLEEGGTKGHTITPTYTGLPTKTYVDKVAAGHVKYLGTVTALTGLSTAAGQGDFYRVSTQFTFGSEAAHVGDILIATKDNPAQNITDWDLIHTEVDSNTWVENKVNAAGYVTAPGTSNANKVWKTDGSGNPGWRDDANTDTHNSHAVISGKKADGSTDIKGSASAGDITLGNSGVIAGEYGPTADATPGYGATFNVPDIKVNAKGIVTSVVNRTVKIPTSNNTDTNQKIKVGNVTFGASDEVNIVAGSNVLVTGNTSNKTVTISADISTLISSGREDPSTSTTSQYYFKY